MTEVTPGFLAYVAVRVSSYIIALLFLTDSLIEVRFALSSEPTFINSGKDTAFNHEQFYNDLVAYLEDPACKAETTERIEW
jgi:hypothetical protein